MCLLCSHSPILPGLWWPAPSAGRRRPAASPSPTPAPSPSGSSRSSTGPESACPCPRSHTAATTQQTLSATITSRQTHSSKLSASRSDTHLGVASEEAVRDGDVDVKPQRLQDAGLHGDQLLPLVRVVANVEEVVDTGRTALLQGHQNTTRDEL